MTKDYYLKKTKKCQKKQQNLIKKKTNKNIKNI